MRLRGALMDLSHTYINIRYSVLIQYKTKSKTPYMRPGLSGRTHIVFSHDTER